MKRFILLATIVIAGMGLAVHAQGPRGRGGRGGRGGQEIKIVKQFDKNADGWLNAEERKAARQYVTTQGFTGGRGFGGPRGGRGGFFGFGGSSQAAKGETIRPASVKTYPNAPLYDETVLRTLFVTFEENDWERELEDFHGTDVDVAATVMVDGKTYRDVGFHFRGNSSYGMVPSGLKRSFNVSVDMAHDGQTVGGYRTLNLLNSHEDPTLMRAVLFLHIARNYFPAEKANFVRVVINGENWGIYQSVEQFNKDFTKENYKDSGGARWKTPGSPGARAGLEYFGDNVASYKGTYEIKTKDDPAQWAALINLCKVLNQTPAGQLEKALAPILDIDGALRFLALDNALVNADGYWTRASDYSIYRDSTGKFHLLPYDVNEAFSVGGGPGGRGGFAPPEILGGRRGGPGGFGFPGGPGGAGPTVDPLIGLRDSATPLRSKLLAVPALQEKYLGYVRDIAAKWLDWKTLGPLVEQYKTLIDVEVKADTKKLDSYEDFLTGTTGANRSLKSFAAARREFLLRTKA
jgi:spore coat protein CotH